jgi:hypothetical protein
LDDCAATVTGFISEEEEDEEDELVAFSLEVMSLLLIRYADGGRYERKRRIFVTFTRGLFPTETVKASIDSTTGGEIASFRLRASIRNGAIRRTKLSSIFSSIAWRRTLPTLI